MLAPRRGLFAIEKSKSKPEIATNNILPELSNFGSPPAEPGVYLEEISPYVFQQCEHRVKIFPAPTRVSGGLKISGVSAGAEDISH